MNQAPKCPEESNAQKKFIMELVDFAGEALASTYKDLMCESPLNIRAEHSIVNLAVMIFLEEWLENDRNATQTVNSFCSHPYSLRSEEKSRKNDVCYDENCAGHSNFDAYLADFYKAERLFRKMQELGKEQSDREQINTPTLTEKSTKGRYYNFTELRFMQLYATRTEKCSQLEIYKLFALRKDFMKITSKKKNPYDSLKVAYHAYYDIFDEICIMQNPREYVIATMQIHQFEMAFHFHFVAVLAKFMTSHPNFDIDKCLWDTRPLYRRYACTPQDSSPIVFSPWDILSYDVTIESLLLKDVTEESKCNLLDFYLCYNIILKVVINKLNEKYSPMQMPSWTDETFEAAESFIRDAYPIADMISEFNIAQFDDEKYYLCIAEIYQHLNSAENQEGTVLPLEEYRKELKTVLSRSKRN